MTTASGWADISVAKQPLELPLWPLALFTFWECYVADVRPLDHLVTAGLIAIFVLRSEREINAERTSRMLLVAAAVWIATFRSNFLFADAWRSASGVVEGSILALIVASASWRSGDIQRFLKTLVIVHACALLLQFAVYHLFHYPINYWGWLGRALRTDSGMGMRPAGFFLEPAHYTLMMFSLLSLYRLVGGVSAAVELLGLGTMMLSISLWGWVGVVVYTVIFRWRWALICLPCALVGLAYVAINLGRNGVTDNIVLWVVVRRILYPGNDNSGNSRYSSLLSISDVWDWKLWFGEGISNNYYVYGANGLSFLLTASGIVGVIVIGLLWLGILPRGRKIRGLLSLGFMLSAATQWTIAWWWVWLALAASTGLDDAKSFLAQILPLARKSAAIRS